MGNLKNIMFVFGTLKYVGHLNTYVSSITGTLECGVKHLYLYLYVCVCVCACVFLYDLGVLRADFPTLCKYKMQSYNVNWDCKLNHSN